MENNTDWTKQVLKILAITVAVVLVGFGGFYVWDNYLRSEPTIIDNVIDHMEKLVRANPNDPDIRVAVADVYLTNDMYRQAITQYNEALKLVPEHKGAFFGLGSVYLLLGRYAEATDHLNKVIEMGKDNEMARLDKQLQTSYYYLGQIYLDNGDIDQAIEHLEIALALDRVDADALYLLARAYQVSEEYQQAAEYYAGCIALDPSFIEAYQGITECYQALGDSAGTAYGNGMVALLSGRYQQAIPELEVAVVDGPDAANAFWGLGSAYEKSGEIDKAERSYQQALAVNPDHFLARAAAGRLESILQ